MKTPALRSARIEVLQNIACAAVVTIPFGAGAVMAACESLQPASGCAVVERCAAASPPAPTSITRLDTV